MHFENSVRFPTFHQFFSSFFLFLKQKMKDDADGDKKQQIHHIQNLYAFNLFCQKRFDDSMQVFAKLGTGEEQVYVNNNVSPVN